MSTFETRSFFFQSPSNTFETCCSLPQSTIRNKPSWLILIIIEMETPPLDLCDDYSPARTSSFGFSQALQDFLARNQISFIGPFRMRLEGTINNSWRLLVEGETSRSDWNAPNQVGLDLAWPSIPSSPGDILAPEMAGPSTSTTSGSSSVRDPTS